MAIVNFTAGNQLPAADLNNNFAETARTALTLIPQSALTADHSAAINVPTTNNTTMSLGQVIVPFRITANKLTFKSGASITVAGTIDITMYAEDGQSQIFSVTSGTISAGNTLTSVSLSSVLILPGIYWIAFNANGTADLQIVGWGNSAVSPFTATEGIGTDVASEPVMQGTLTITASTPPATITPTSITEAITKTMIFRLDN